MSTQNTFLTIKALPHNGLPPSNATVEQADTSLQGVFTKFGITQAIPTPIVEGKGNFYIDYPGDIFYFHPDHLGSSNYITNLNGNISQHMEYLPFGEMLVEEHKNSNNSPFKFNGKELDEETGNYYYGARYYDPKFSIWLSVDPLAEKYPGWSPYNYTLLNPVKLIDPDGRSVDEPDDWIKYKKTGEVIWVDESGEDAKTTAAFIFGDDWDPINGAHNPENYEKLGDSFFGFTKGNFSDKAQIMKQREDYLMEVTSKVNQITGIDDIDGTYNMTLDYLKENYMGIKPDNISSSWRRGNSVEIVDMAWSLGGGDIYKKGASKSLGRIIGGTTTTFIDAFLSSQPLNNNPTPSEKQTFKARQAFREKALPGLQKTATQLKIRQHQL